MIKWLPCYLKSEFLLLRNFKIKFCYCKCRGSQQNEDMLTPV